MEFPIENLLKRTTLRLSAFLTTVARRHFLLSALMPRLRIELVSIAVQYSCLVARSGLGSPGCVDECKDSPHAGRFVRVYTSGQTTSGCGE